MEKMRKVMRTIFYELALLGTATVMEVALGIPLWGWVAIVICSACLGGILHWDDMVHGVKVITKHYSHTDERIGIKEEHESTLYGPDGEVKGHWRNDHN